MRRITFLLAFAGIMATLNGCAAEHYAGHASSDGPLEADDSVHEHCIKHPEDCPDPDIEEHGTDDDLKDPGTQNTVPDPTWSCGLDFLEIADAGAVDQSTFIRDFEFSDGTVLASMTGFFASTDCLQIDGAELPGTTMLCVRSKDPSGDAIIGSLSVFTSGTWEGLTTTTCDHDLAIRAEVDGSASTKEVAGAGEDNCSNSSSTLDWGVRNSVLMVYSQQTADNPNPEAFSLVKLEFEDCK